MPGTVVLVVGSVGGGVVELALPGTVVTTGVVVVTPVDAVVEAVLVVVEDSVVVLVDSGSVVDAVVDETVVVDVLSCAPASV
jgi:hypothetical protein